VQLLQERGYIVEKEHIANGLARTRWPGRLENFYLDRNLRVAADSEDRVQFLLDGAHNPAGVSALKQALAQEFSYDRLFLIWGAMSDKDLLSTLQEISPMAHRILFTRTQSERSATAEQLLDALPSAMQEKAVVSDSVQDAVSTALLNAGSDDLICIAGSLYLVGEVRQLLLGGIVSNG
jgi:dihydrofolate synthase/folylpolyglutamate synthase